MKVKFDTEMFMQEKVGFIICPETEFETDLISKVFSKGRGVDGFVKCGLNPADVVGLKVYTAWWDRPSSAKEENKTKNS